MFKNQETILDVSNISKKYPGVNALSNVSFGLYKREIHAIAGENGAGKSTLVKVLAGLVKRDSGIIIKNNMPIEIHNNLDATKLGISFVHQDFGIISKMSIAENFYLGTTFPTNKNGKIQWSIAYDEVSKLLDKFGMSKIDPRKPAATLSPGEIQMFTIIKALSTNCKILILDEPTSSLSSGEKGILFQALSDFKDKGMSIVFITHKLEEIFEIADRVTVMRDGKVINTSWTKDITVDDIIMFMTGKKIGAKYPKRNVVNKDIIALQVKHLNSEKVKNITFNVREGEVFGIIGLVGSGRTELARLLSGIDFPENGEIILFNRSIVFHGIREAIKNGICLVPENKRTQGLVMNFSVCENIFLPILEKMCCGFPRHFDNGKIRKIAQKFVNSLSIKTQNVYQKVKFLSGGNQQKVVLSKWLSTEVKLLILDEPTKGIDVGAKAEIYNILNKLAKQGIPIIMISSDIPEVLGVSNRIGVLNNRELMGILESEKTNEKEVLNLMFGRKKHFQC